LYFLSSRRDGIPGLWARRADGAGEASPVEIPGSPMLEHDMTPDGTWLVASLLSTRGNRDIVAYLMDTDTAEVPLLTSEHDEISPALSPDGRWLAYASLETGQWEIYIRPFPDVDSGRWLVSNGGGVSPVWAHSGRELFYLSPNPDMMVASVQTSDGLRVTGRERLFSLPSNIYVEDGGVYFDISPDDQDFIMLRDVGSDAAPALAPLVLVENWLEEVKARAAGQGG
jgi:hypothetical protein